MVTIADVMHALETIAPLVLAAEWDNVGLLLGDAAAPVQRVMTCLTVTPASAAEAIDAGAELIVTHHPVLFRPTQRLTTVTAEGRMLLALLRAGVAVYSAHTAFDNAAGGINDILAHRLGLAGVGVLRPAPSPLPLSPVGERGEGSDAQCKIVVFVPDADLQRVADALFAAGAGRIGQYQECSFRLAGTGTFFGTDSTNPTVGQKGRREEVQEWRLEAICPEALVGGAVAAMRKAHSYEEPAYDVYPLRQSAARAGAGRIGTLPQPMPLADCARQLRTILSAAVVQYVGPADRAVSRVAIACGAAGEFLDDARRAQADVFLTGEVRFHDCVAAEARGLALLVPGHYASERCGIEELAVTLKQRMPAVDVWPSRSERDPLQLA